MADGYWSRQRQQQLQKEQERQQLHPSAGLLKRHRSDYDLSHSGLPLSYEMHNYLPQNDDLGGAHAVKDTKTIGSAYDLYLQSAKLSSGEASGYGVPWEGREVRDEVHSLPPSDGRDLVAMRRGGMHSLPLSDPVAMSRGGAIGLDYAANGRGIPVDHHSPVDMMARPGRETRSLPADASNTLYIEGLPSNCTRREVAHIFRPFVGYKDVRLVTKESKHRSGEPVILSFVDFTTAACAATAMSAVQGYKMDEHDPDSAYLRLQFSKHPGPRGAPPRRAGRR